MATFRAELRRQVAESNPDYTTVTVEADTEAKAQKQLADLIADDNWKPGWFSRNEGDESWADGSGIEVLNVEKVND